MGGVSMWHWIVVIAVIILLFGRGRVSGFLGDLGNGIRSFKRELSDETQETEGIVQAPSLNDVNEARIEP